MLIKNQDEMLVNGSMGRITRFVDPNTYGAFDEQDAKPGAPPSKGKKNTSVSTPVLYPEVEFALPNGNKRLVLITPEISKVELPNGEVQVSRSQVINLLLRSIWSLNVSCFSYH